jgi:hypothetical protein
MTDPYLQNNAAKRNFLKKGVIVLIVLALIFTAFMARFALSGSRSDFLNGAPDSDTAYGIAKEFIQPTIKSHHVVFQETGYQCAAKPDSTFIIKSYAESKDEPGPKNITTFEISLKYIGGKISDKKSWKIIGLNEN